MNRVSRSLILCLVLGPLTACNAKDETIGVTMTGIDHLAEHLSIQNFWVNGAAGQQAGQGGSTVCCATIPVASGRQDTVKVRWAVTNWKRRVYGYYEREVPLERCKGPLECAMLHRSISGVDLPPRFPIHSVGY